MTKTLDSNKEDTTMTTDTHTAKCPRCGGPIPAPPPPLPPRYCERCYDAVSRQLAVEGLNVNGDERKRRELIAKLRAFYGRNARK